MQAVPAEAGDEVSGPAAVRIMTLQASPVRLDLLGLVVKVDQTALVVEARSGTGKPLGAVAGEAVRLVGQVDLGQVIDEFAAQAGGTFRSFARLASGNKLLQGAEMGRILAAMAGQRINAGLRRMVPRRGEATANAPV